MAHTQIAAQIHVSGQRQHTASADDPAMPDNDRAVMHRGLDKKDIFQQFTDHGAVQLRAGAHDIIQIDVALKYHQHAGLGTAQFAAGHHRLVDSLFHFRNLLFRTEHPHQADILAAQPLQDLPDLRLEQDDQRQNTPFHHMAEDIADRPQFQRRGQPQRQKENANALENILRPGTLYKRKQLIYQKDDDGYIHQVCDFQQR